jgi:hypothetical protein
MPDVILAASRDASCVAMPNTRSRKKLHVAIVEGEVPATYWENSELVANAACDPQTMPLDMSLATRAAEVHESRRCRRRGCAARWPDYEARTNTGSSATARDGSVGSLPDQ